jgi:hypothetical protein
MRFQQPVDGERADVDVAHQGIELGCGAPLVLLAVIAPRRADQDAIIALNPDWICMAALVSLIR